MEINLSAAMAIRESHQKVTSFVGFVEYCGNYYKEIEAAVYTEKQSFVLFAWIIYHFHTEENEAWSDTVSMDLLKPEDQTDQHLK